MTRGRKPKDTIELHDEDLDGITITVSDGSEAVELPDAVPAAIEEKETIAPTQQERKDMALRNAANILKVRGHVREGANSGKMASVYELVLPRGHVRYFTLPLWVNEEAVLDAWHICKPYMSAEDFVCFVKTTLGISNLVLYSYFKRVSLS